MSVAESTENLIGNKLQKLIELRGVKISELARALELPSTTISYIISGVIKEPSVVKLKKIADYFEVDLNYFFGEESEPVRNGEEFQDRTLSLGDAEGRVLPILEKEYVRGWLSVKEKRAEIPRSSFLVTEKKVSEDAFAFNIGTTSKGKIPAGTIVIVEPHEKYKQGDYLLVSVRKNRPSVRIALSSGNGYYLNSTSIYEMGEPLDESVSVIGKIIEYRYDFPKN